MVAQGVDRRSLALRILLLAALMPSGMACVGVGDGSLHVRGGRGGEENVRLPDAEQMIDDLDRIMTANGTIGVKSPDVWGQDRLAKFRSEYETQMSEWLKTAFKGEVNAAVRRGETEVRRLHVGTTLAEPARTEPGKSGETGTGTGSADSLARSLANADASALAAGSLPEKTSVLLEPTVVLDEHSNYLNHLNQLRRINAGDDLTDRPGYGLYLVRIPVTLSPGPRSRRGKGAIITVSAKSLMTRDTLRNTLRNAVINETVNNLTQAICNQPGQDGEPASGPGAGSFSLVAYGDTEVFYGPTNIALLRGEVEHQLARDLADEPHHRSARVAEWLRGELEASYHLLEEAAAPVRSGQRLAAFDPLEEIGDLVVHRDYTRLAMLQPTGVKDTQVLRAAGTARHAADDDPAAQRRRVADVLGFALRIQAAAVNRRLKQDMADRDANLKQQDLKHTSFFDPEAPAEVIRLFEKYVNAKWPLRVYAIEPVIAQQNVADAFGRRTQSALEVAAAAPAGPLKVLGGLASAGLAAERKAAEDETAIRLNPTMVGFGAGESTFGWVFYPRIQTRARDGRLLTDVALLLNGRFPDPTGKDQSVEPGQRECTALIVMPNFVPKIEFTTVANWFRTSEVGDGQKSDLEKSSTLARRLVSAENALNRARIEGQYRPEEYQIALERLSQLKSLMPTQRLQVSVPYTDDNNDSRIFCSQGGQLRPSLLAWHGRPPQEGDESTILIEGKNFSVHDTHVIAGGKPARAVLVSRNVMEVTIAKDACASPSLDGRPLLDLSVATPNGVSNHLLIEMHPPCPDHKRPPESSPVAGAPPLEGHHASPTTHETTLHEKEKRLPPKMSQEGRLPGVRPGQPSSSLAGSPGQ